MTAYGTNESISANGTNGTTSRAAWVPRAQALYESSLDEIHRRTDRMFANLMIFQWIAGIAAALWISPRTWAGASSQVHVHVWAAVFLGVATASQWRWLEHAGWVLFEDVFLVISIRQSLKDMFDVAARRSQLEDHNAEIEHKVLERTADLVAAQKLLLDATRRAGMAEVA